MYLRSFFGRKYGISSCQAKIRISIEHSIERRWIKNFTRYFKSQLTQLDQPWPYRNFSYQGLLPKDLWHLVVQLLASVTHSSSWTFSQIDRFLVTKTKLLPYLEHYSAYTFEPACSKNMFTKICSIGCSMSRPGNAEVRF